MIRNQSIVILSTLLPGLQRVDYILADWHVKKLSTSCVYRKASIPFESDHRLLVLHCSFQKNLKNLMIDDRFDNINTFV